MSEPAVSGKSPLLSRLSFMQWVAVVLAVLAIIFILMNRDTTSISFFGVTVSAPLWLTLILVFAVGWLTGVLTMRRRRGAQKP